MMEESLRERLRVVGEMAEKFFPAGFCSEVVELVELMPKTQAAAVLTTYDFFLQTQQKYQSVAHGVYEDLISSLRGEVGSGSRWRMDYLVEAAVTPYEEEYLRPLRMAYRECELKPANHHNSEDLRRMMSAISSLEFVMNDSPSYPSERPLKFYQFLHSGGHLNSVGAEALLRRLMPHAQNLLAEHQRLLRARPYPDRLAVAAG